MRQENLRLERSVHERTQELRRAMAELGAERNRLNRLLQRLDEGVIAVSPELHVVFANDAAAGIFGRTLDAGAILPEPWDDFSLNEIVTAAFEAGAQPLEYTVRPDRDHSYAVGVLPAQVAPDVLLLLRDVSEHERRERAERDFVTNAAHELRTPLAAIMSSIEVLQGGAKEIPEQRDRFLAHVDRETRRLARLARALLVLARAQTQRETPRQELIEIEGLLADVAAGLPPREGVEIELDCPHGLAVIANRELAEQALANLAGNAVKYTTRGRVILSARPADGNQIELVVADTGPGVEPRDQPRVFERFYRAEGRESEGTSFGLGLAIVEQSVAALGGQAELRSRPGGGTTARIVLPNRGTITT